MYDPTKHRRSANLPVDGLGRLVTNYAQRQGNNRARSCWRNRQAWKRSSQLQKGEVIGFLNAYHACWDCPGCKWHYGFCESGQFQMQGRAKDGFRIIDHRAATVLPIGMDAQKRRH